ncbi:MAG: glycosyltransferase WbuB [Bacteroidetes bacterium]|nr:MAG: glycosyltransferase WbuB [Bacteroidota bacterium]
MKILYFYQYFSTPKGSWGTRVYEFAKEWVAEGHEVTVVSSIYSKSDLTAERLIEDQLFDGIKVKVLNIRIDNKQSFIKRILTFFAYSVLSSWYALTLKADVVIASSGPITVGLPGLVARYLRKRKFVFETRDLWPEGAIELGIIRKEWMKKLAYWFERKCYRAADLVVSLSPGMKNYIEQNHGHPNVISVTNAANIALFSNIQPFANNAFKAGKYAIYTGNIGVVNNSYWLYNAAKHLKSLGRDDIKILLVGEGQQREELELLAKDEGTDNFIRLGLMPKKELVPFVQHAMVSLVPLKGTPVLNTSSPNKFFESLAAGVPVVQNTTGWMKDFLEEHEVGFTVDPNDAEALATLLIELDDKSDELKKMGKQAKKISSTEFDKNILAKKMLAAIVAVGEKKNG